MMSTSTRIGPGRRTSTLASIRISTPTSRLHWTGSSTGACCSRAGGFGLGAVLLAACSAGRASTSTGASSTSSTSSSSSSSSGAVVGSSSSSSSSSTLAGFDEFAATVKVIAQGAHWLVESNGMPSHEMMVGITSWQQQVPVPQAYRGTNAWQLPASPVLAGSPVSARTGLFRGAIAIAVNGVPIFNALNNRGDDAFIAGELDRWGGHAGRADDYHYHVAPLHLQDVVGPSKPIAYALDGFAIYGRTEPDGAPVTGLDEYNGHTVSGAYHYHGTTTYPYINGGLRGVVKVAADQIEPQPSTKGFRPDGQPLRGATITAFDSPATGRYQLEYTMNGRAQQIAYEVKDASVTFVFTDTAGGVRTETYAR